MWATKSSYGGASPAKINTPATCMCDVAFSIWRNEASSGDSRSGEAITGKVPRTGAGPKRESALEDDVVARTAVEHVERRAADEDVVAGLTEQRVRAGAADEDVGTVAAVLRQRERAGLQGAGVDDVVAREAVDVQSVVGPFGMQDVRPGGEPGDHHAVGAPGHRGHVVARRPLHGDGVRSSVPGDAVRTREIRGELAEVRAAEIVLRDGVGPAEGAKPHPLD